MEELTTKIKNSITAAQDLPEVKRTEDGKIDLASILVGKDEKENIIIPDDIFEAYYKELPVKVINESRTWRTTSTGGKIKILGGDPENDKLIQNKGREANALTWIQRRSMRETADYLLTLKGDQDAIEELGLPEGTDAQTVIMQRLITELQHKIDPASYKALEATIGEQPTAKIDASVTQLTPEDKELMLRVASRLPE